MVARGRDAVIRLVPLDCMRQLPRQRSVTESHDAGNLQHDGGGTSTITPA